MVLSKLHEHGVEPIFMDLEEALPVTTAIGACERGWRLQVRGLRRLVLHQGKAQTTGTQPAIGAAYPSHTAVPLPPTRAPAAGRSALAGGTSPRGFNASVSATVLAMLEEAVCAHAAAFVGSKVGAG